MISSEYPDTYVICYARPSNRWAAFSIRARQLGMGADPKEALANAITAVDQAMQTSVEHPNTHGSSSSFALMLTLAKTAQLLPVGECLPGVVYKYQRS